MDQPQNPHKACLYQDHKNKSISFICLDKQCKAISRTACQQCMINKIHENCKQFLTFDNSDLEFPNLQVQYGPNHRLFNLSTFLYVQEQEIKDKIDSKFDSLLKEVTIQINKVRKDYKVLCLSNLQNFKEQFKDVKIKQEPYHDISTLNDIMRQYQEKQKGIEELNQQLIIKQQEYNLKEKEEQDLENKYKDALQDYFPLDIDESKLNIPKNRFCLDLQSITKIQINKLKPIDGFEQSCLEQGNDVYNGVNDDQRDGAIFKSEKSFKSKDQIIFKFKILKLKDTIFSLGISSKEESQDKKKFWFDSGNQICQSERFVNGEFIQKGEISFKEMLKEGQVVIIEAYVKENILVIKDENLKCIMENKMEFDQEIDDWVIVIGSNNTKAGYIFSIQVL